MKKIVILFLILFLIGCGKDEVKVSYDDNYYKIASPYKEALGSYSIKSYDKINVESMLMKISTNYFKVNNSLYQEGQYLSSTEIKDLINLYNDIDEITIDKVKINPDYIVSIYEQNYLATNNNLKGISIAIVLDNKQYYNDTSYKIVDEQIVLEYGKEKAKELVNYLNSKNLGNVKIIVGLYLDGFKYVLETDKDDLKVNYVNYNYKSLDSSYIMNNDINNYNNALAIKNALSYDSNLYTSILGLYQDNNLVEVNITINKSFFKQSEILNIANIIADNLAFESKVLVKVYLKSNTKTRAFLNKKIDETKIETYILEE